MFNATTWILFTSFCISGSATQGQLVFFPFSVIILFKDWNMESSEGLFTYMPSGLCCPWSLTVAGAIGKNTFTWYGLLLHIKVGFHTLNERFRQKPYKFHDLESEVRRPLSWYNLLANALTKSCSISSEGKIKFPCWWRSDSSLEEHMDQKCFSVFFWKIQSATVLCHFPIICAICPNPPQNPTTLWHQAQTQIQDRFI